MIRMLGHQRMHQDWSRRALDCLLVHCCDFCLMLLSANPVLQGSMTLPGIVCMLQLHHRRNVSKPQRAVRLIDFSNSLGSLTNTHAGMHNCSRTPAPPIAAIQVLHAQSDMLFCRRQQENILHSKNKSTRRGWFFGCTQSLQYRARRLRTLKISKP